MTESGFHLGKYDDKGSPCLSMTLFGMKNVKQGLTCTGLIDTGFSGFIQIPFDIACALGAPLHGIKSFTLANGEPVNMIMALVQSEFAGKKKIGVASISPSDEILVGMEFLRIFSVDLLVSREYVSLLDEKLIKDRIQELEDRPPPDS